MKSECIEFLDEEGSLWHPEENRLAWILRWNLEQLLARSFRRVLGSWQWAVWGVAGTTSSRNFDSIGENRMFCLCVHSSHSLLSGYYRQEQPAGRTLVVNMPVDIGSCLRLRRQSVCHVTPPGQCCLSKAARAFCLIFRGWCPSVKPSRWPQLTFPEVAVKLAFSVAILWWSLILHVLWW